MEVWTDYAAKSFAGGKGTKKKPYIIKTPQQLAKLANNVRKGKLYKGKYFKLAKDIDLKGKYWISITHCAYDNYFIGAFINESFAGTFDGGNHKIKNMKSFDEPFQLTWGEDVIVNAPWYEENGGLFGYVENCTIKNVGIENAFNSNSNSGLLCSGVTEKVKISNCYTTGTSSGYALTGVINNYGCKIKNCFSSAVVQKGMFGSVDTSKTDKNIISNCYFCGELYDNDSKYKFGPISYNASSFRNSHNTYIVNCFAVCKSPNNIGFITNNYDAKISKCYYLKDNKYGIKTNEAKKLTSLSAKSKSFFKKKSTFTNSKNWNKNYSWDFKNTWAIKKDVNNGYPYLKANKPLKSKNKTSTKTWLDYAATKFAGGTGTKKDPYQIKTPQQLARLAKLYRFGGGEGVYFKLMKNIDLSAHKWFPIGTGEFINLKDSPLRYKRTFLGNIDGNGKTISNMTVKISGDHAAFICKAALGTIKNLSFKNANISAESYAAVICASQRNSSVVENCKVYGGSVKGKDNVGSFSGSLSPSGNIAYCESTSAVSGNDFVGGICGSVKGTISNSSYSGKLYGKRFFAGISGELNGCIKNCYSIGSDLYYLSNEFQLSPNCEISSSYSFNNVGKIISYKYGNQDSSAELSKENMNKRENYKNFDFNSVWEISSNKNGGMPVLKKGSFKSLVSYPSGSWSKNCASKFASGKGTKNSPYVISTPGQLALAVKNIVKSDTTKKHYYKLKNNIDLSGKIWDFSTEGHYVEHIVYFDGNGKTISNIKFKDGNGLIPVWLTKGKISNLTLKNVKGRTQSCVVLYNDAKIVNCSVSGTIIAGFEGPSDFSSAAICVDNYGTIDKCSFNGTFYGGDVTSSVICCYNQGTITNSTSQGKGYSVYPLVESQYSTMKNCSSSMKIIK